DTVLKVKLLCLITQDTTQCTAIDILSRRAPLATVGCEASGTM
ncbi:MAG: hypothetical protein ACI85U_001556, partial [Candidatus Promineifilaceae bacterium]